IRADRDVDSGQLEQIVPLLSDRLQGKKIGDLMELKNVELNEEGWYDKLTRDSFLFIKKFMEERNYRRFYIEGTLNLISDEENPDQDTRDLKKALTRLDGKRLARMAEKCDKEKNNINAVVGLDDASSFLPYSLVVKHLANCSSSLGILGPIDMDYSKSFSTVQYIGSRLDSLLTAGKKN
ncbi:MAG: hypothetical protein ACOC88_03770, partial [Candidatus Bipolaricaulota bacterium]